MQLSKYTIIIFCCISVVVIVHGVEAQGVRILTTTTTETQGDNSDPNIKDLEREDEKLHEEESGDWDKNGWTKLN